MKKITMLASLMLLSMCIVSQNVPVGFCIDDPTIVVNVLLACDDAFKSMMYEMGALRWVSAKTLVYDGAMPAVSELFEEAFGVTFYWGFGWQDWDSSDVSAIGDQMVEDAISDTGFDKGIVIGGKRIDILMAWTGRLMYPAGYAPSPLNACVIMAPIFPTTIENCAQHELDHLFNREGHCKNVCIMNEDPNEALKYNAWCETCFQIINSNKFKFNVVGDVDGNHVVDACDLAQVNCRFGSQKGDDDWAPSCDINGDYLIDTEDASIISMHLGETAPEGEYILSISAGVGGTTDPIPEIYFYEPETFVTVTADADSGYRFDYWLLDGATFYDNPIGVTMNSDRTLEAHFCYNNPPNTPYRPVGWDSGYTGSSYSYYTSTTDPDDDDVRYEFYWGDRTFTTTGWYESGAKATAYHEWDSAGCYGVAVRAVDLYGEYSDWSEYLLVIIEKYEYIPGPGWPPVCPTLFVWNGSQYLEEALLDIHADSDVTLQHTIAETLVPDKNSYKLSLRELDEFTSHIDQVKLYAVDSDDGEIHEAHLTNATHSELGDVKEQLLHDDDTRVDLTPEQTIDLRFTVPNNIDEVAYFIFEINGYNMKWPGDGPW